MAGKGSTQKLNAKDPRMKKSTRRSRVASGSEQSERSELRFGQTSGTRGKTSCIACAARTPDISSSSCLTCVFSCCTCVFRVVPFAKWLADCCRLGSQAAQDASLLPPGSSGLSRVLPGSTPLSAFATRSALSFLVHMLTEHFSAGVSVLQVGKPKDGSSVGRSPLYWSRGAAGPQHPE